ncbi:MAG: cyclic nucleotide-binding domain-containing protein [Permianibacter sp.]
MHSLIASRFPRDKLQPVLLGLPFFRELAEDAPAELERLLPHTRLLLADPGELIMRKGEFDSWCYFLLKGQLAVQADDGGKVVGYIQPGEMFGALAIMRDSERSASVAVRGSDKEKDRAILFGLDFSPFGELDDFSQVSLATKLKFFQLVVERTEARLHAYEREMPGTDLGIRLATLPAFQGDTDSLAQLQYLHHRADALADLLSEWNLTLENLDNYQPIRELPRADVLADIERLYFG